MTKSTVIYDRFYNRIGLSLKQPKNLHALKLVFGEIISRNNEALSSIIPDKTVFIPNKLEEKYFNTIGINRDEIQQAIADAPDISDDWNTIKNPMYVSLLLLVIYFNNNKNKEMVNQTMFICSLYMYRNVRTKYFRGASEATINVMKYTISRLTYKNDIKKYGSIIKLITKKTEIFLNNWLVDRKSDLAGSVTDDIICKMVNDNHRRYSTVLNNFYAEFKKDSLSGNYLNVDQDIDDGETFIQSDNVSFMVEKNTQKIISKFILSAYPNPVILKQTCVIESGCSINTLRNITNYLYDNHDKEAEKMIRLILQIFLFESKKTVDDVKSLDFLTYMRDFYKKQTTSNPNLNDLKKTIEDVMEGSGTNAKIKRAATRNDCKKALLLYMLIFIQRSLV